MDLQDHSRPINLLCPMHKLHDIYGENGVKEILPTKTYWQNMGVSKNITQDSVSVLTFIDIEKLIKNGAESSFYHTTLNFWRKVLIFFGKCICLFRY